MANTKLFKLEITINGKTHTDTIDTYKNVSRRKTTLAKSYRGKKVIYKISEHLDTSGLDSDTKNSAQNVKFRKKPHNLTLSGSRRPGPPKV